MYLPRNYELNVVYECTSDMFAWKAERILQKPDDVQTK